MFVPQQFKTYLLAVIICCMASCSSVKPETTPTPVVQDNTAQPAQVVFSSCDQNLPHTIYFPPAQTTISSADKVLLARWSACLQQHVDWHVRLEGHTDEEGNRALNLALAERRAQSVANWLIHLGISKKILDVVSYGQELPDQNKSAASAVDLIDRRVVIIVENR